MTIPNTDPLPVLIVDDEIHVLEGVETTLNAGGIDHVIACFDGTQVESILAEREVGVMLLDLWMPHVSGEEILNVVTEHYPEVPVIIVTGANDVETAVRAMRKGAFDYLVKPVESSKLLSVVKRALELRELRRDYTLLTQHLQSGNVENPEAFAGIITQDQRMLSIFRYIETVARTLKPVLITGETGTGKELLARAVHDVSRRPGPFVAVNVAGLDDTMFSDTLFGHVKGAFTGAEGLRPGLIERAAGGTLFLDEIGDLALPSQVKLLRLLEEREYFPLGADILKQSDARVVVATNKTITELEDRRYFRRDLYYRLRTHHVHLPPLRERKDDMPLLLHHFLEKAAAALGKKKPTPPPELYTLLELHDFSGNIREFEAVVFDAVSHHNARVMSLDVFRKHLQRTAGPVLLEKETGVEVDQGGQVRFGERLPSVDEMTDCLVREAVRRAKGNQRIAAEMLGISRTTLNKRLRQML